MVLCCLLASFTAASQVACERCCSCQECEGCILLEVGGRQLAFLLDPVAPGFWQECECDASGCLLFVCSSESFALCLVPHRPLGWEPFGFSKRTTRSFHTPRARLCAFPTPRPGPRPRRRRASRGPRGPTAKGFLARDTPSTRPGGRAGCSRSASRRVPVGPRGIVPRYLGHAVS